jgi:cytochrome c oxidase subunit 2
MLKYFYYFNLNYNFLNINTIFNDSPAPWQLGFQDSAAPGYTGLVTLHNTIGFYLIVISFAVFWALFSTIYYYSSKKNKITYKYLTHGTVLELVWTIAPALVLIAIAFPSFRLLYLMDEVISPTLTIKVIGHQWFWSYEYSDFITDNENTIEFDSYMIPESDLEVGQFRLLDVDNKLIIPVDCHIRLIVTGSDVLHSFGVPSLGLKLDAVPGRLNQVSFLAERSGIYFGQCSEICGVWHGFMPIVIEAVSSSDFLIWINSVGSN